MQNPQTHGISLPLDRFILIEADRLSKQKSHSSSSDGKSPFPTQGTRVTYVNEKLLYRAIYLVVT